MNWEEKALISPLWAMISGSDKSKPRQATQGQPPKGQPPSMKRGGRVRKGGLIRMHKGETVIPVGRGKRGKRGKKRFGSGRM
jgi:hypothetical protein